MVKDKIRTLKTLHDEKIGQLKTHHQNISEATITSFGRQLQQMEELVVSQLGIIDELEQSFLFEDKYADLFDKHFNQNIEYVREQMKRERELLKRVTNPFYDPVVRFDAYRQFAKQYDRELNQKKTLMELLWESLRRKRAADEDAASRDGAEPVFEDGTNTDDGPLDEDDQVQEDFVSGDTSLEEDPASGQGPDDEDDEQKDPPTERELIDALKKEPAVQEECEIKKAVINNSIKFKLEVKITNTLEEEAWGFLYQRYYSVENSTTSKSGQIKGFLKLQELRREYLDRLLAELADETSSKEIFADVKEKLLEHLDKDNVTVY